MDLHGGLQKWVPLKWLVFLRSGVWAPDGQILKTETVQTDTTTFQVKENLK